MYTLAPFKYIFGVPSITLECIIIIIVLNCSHFLFKHIFNVYIFIMSYGS